MNWIAVKYFSLDQDLQELSDYLRARGLQHRITEEQGQQCLWVLDERVVPALQEFLAQYSQGDVRLEPATVAESTPYSPPSLVQQAAQVPVVILLIVLSALGAFLVESGSQLVHWFSFQEFSTTRITPLADSLAAGEVWRLLTPIFLHFGIFHVLFNSLWMWDLGRRLEYLMGAWSFLLFVVLTGVASNVAQYLWSGTPAFGGMSGVVYALVGFIAVRQRMVPHPLVAVPSALIGFMLFWLVLCMTGVVDYFIAGSVANAAHLGGLIAGALYALMTTQFFRR
ncbi:rhomboid family intramembrane serine protease [Cellvibrio sp. KY-GH-1]|uniref:rhomboid family intramembrane serine protease n=1 Tax=Cellvibrio sp. KY-GH-1 TaxID=2303332 RepID=UPI0012460A41|nr:rhomboid family intramembrane serine protease [Cellvibrio sp. KY-GH-1]QEY18930.1 rhomboid family intramembrane serine protease [Cellvibrio sp. KY-GH-1]